MTQSLLTPHQSQYVAWLLTRRAAGDSVESLASTLVDSQVDLNPHQVDAALFACRNPLSRGVISSEIDELRHFKMLATSIRDNTNGKALLTALDKAFAELDRLGAAKKAIIFTESRRTQDYLLSLLADTPYGDGIVLFNGTNSDARAQATYKDWIKRFEGTDHITGSKTADTRAALVEHFKERGTVRRWSRRARFCWRTSTRKYRTSSASAPRTAAVRVTASSEC